VESTQKKTGSSSARMGVPGKETEALIQESVSTTLSAGGSLPGRAWSRVVVWVATCPSRGRPTHQKRMRHKMGLVGNACAGGEQCAGCAGILLHIRLREDREPGTMETVARHLADAGAYTQRETRRRAQPATENPPALSGGRICGVDRNVLCVCQPGRDSLLGGRRPA